MKSYAITPVGKPRQTRSDKWKRRPAVLRYRSFCDSVRRQNMVLSDCGAHITFVLPMPLSWSKKKREEMKGKHHQQKPDCDNLLKSLLDAIYDDDAHIWDCRITKVWGEHGQIIIRDGAA